MKPRDHDYSMYFAFIAFFLWLLAFEQCNANMKRESIERELDDISHELRMMRYERN